MKIFKDIQVVGTSFVDIPDTDLLYGNITHKDDGLSVKQTFAKLVKEPTNPYDNKAIAVYILATNTDNFPFDTSNLDVKGKYIRIGYIGKKDEIYSILNNEPKNTFNGLVSITTYLKMLTHENSYYNRKFTISIAI